MSILILTTLTHLLAIPFSPSPYYSALITSSITVDTLFSYSQLPVTSNLGLFNILISMIWFITDMGYPIDDKVSVEIITLNTAVAILNPILSQFDYTIGHSVWNILSALKAIYITNLLHAQGSNNLL